MSEPSEVQALEEQLALLGGATMAAVESGSTRGLLQVLGMLPYLQTLPAYRQHRKRVEAKLKEGPKVSAIELNERDMVVVVIRSFFDVPEETPNAEVIANTDPAFVDLSRNAVRALMTHWSAAIRASGLPPLSAEKALDATGLGAVEPEGSGHA